MTKTKTSMTKTNLHLECQRNDLQNLSNRLKTFLLLLITYASRYTCLHPSDLDALHEYNCIYDHFQ